MALTSSAQVNGRVTPSPAEEEELYSQLLLLRDAVLAGKHPVFKLPQTVIDQLKASAGTANGSLTSSAQPTGLNGVLNGVATNANAAANNVQHPAASLPGLQASAVPKGAVPPTLNPTSSNGLNPIFLEKSQSLVRAEGRLKRQRIERDLLLQLEQRKHLRDRDPGADAPALINVAAILASTRIGETHLSGLKPARAGSSASTSFDENDYYSSQVESDWSSPASASKGFSDHGAGAFTAGVNHANNLSAARTNSVGKKHVRDPIPTVHIDDVQMDLGDDEDDEYTPPDAATFDDYEPQLATGDQGDDDNSEYEPGEIVPESNNNTPNGHGQHLAEPSPKVPVIRNHLTHIAAPQPNRVSPLAVAKGPSIELELVNGRPEVVQKPRQKQHAVQSRASTASPSGNGAGGSSKKKRNKSKRKREPEPSARSKRKRERRAAAQSPPSPAYREPRIKDEPISPPPFATLPEVQQYGQSRPLHGPLEIDLVSPRHVPQQAVYANDHSAPGLRYEFAQPGPPAVVRVASPAAYRPAQRDTQDLRRVASLQYAQGAPSPAPYRTVSMPFPDHRMVQSPHSLMELEPARYHDPAPANSMSYVPADRSNSPPRLQAYHDPYTRVQSPAMAPPRRIVVDQYGNQYYAAEAVQNPAAGPASLSIARASIAPPERRPTVELSHERAPSRVANTYGQPMSVPGHYEQPDSRMGPPPAPIRRVLDDRPVQYAGTNGYGIHEYSTRPMDQVRYAEAPTSPVYQAAPRYEQMPPPPTSPVYAPTRSYSVRPEEPARMKSGYTTRQGSVAPVQYVRQEVAPPAPIRAMTVAPGYEHPTAQPRSYSQVTQQVRYVDQYGREVFPEVRQVAAVEQHRYQ